MSYDQTISFAWGSRLGTCFLEDVCRLLLSSYCEVGEKRWLRRRRSRARCTGEVCHFEEGVISEMELVFDGAFEVD